MRKATSIQGKCAVKSAAQFHGFAAKVKVSVLCVTFAALTQDGLQKSSDDILKAVLDEMKNCHHGITIPELARKTALEEVLIQSLVEDLSKRLLVKKGGKKRHGHTVWLA